jgi:hypothetical protein
MPPKVADVTIPGFRGIADSKEIDLNCELVQNDD